MSLRCGLAGRYAEFSKAIVEMTLEGKKPDQPDLIYYGVFRDDSDRPGASQIHKKVLHDIESKIFQHWDGLSSSPSKTRPKSQPSRLVSGLTLISCTEQGPMWPSSLNSKFAAGSPEAKELETLMKEFNTEFPPPSNTNTSSGTTATTPASTTQRASGQPDFSVDGGKEPLDVTRVVDLLVEAPPPPDQRLCCVNGRASKPNVLVDKHYKIWIGNPGDQEASYSGEIFGFNTGSFEYKVINHTSKRDASGIAFRLTTDTDLIVHDKVVLPFCKFLHNAAVKHGLADVTLTDHLLEPKLHP
ncbi:FO synthase subunit 1, partial [Durusdinium trenchii]